jgi:hypothetical protein
MTDALIVEKLVQEARDLMPVGGFGLYEFIWTLNGENPDMPASEKLATARAAFEHLASEGGIRVVLYDWPPRDIVGELDPSDVREEHFKNPDEVLPYAAVIPLDL